MGVRVSGVERDLIHPPAVYRNQLWGQTRLLRALLTQVLKISEDGDCTASVASCCTTCLSSREEFHRIAASAFLRPVGSCPFPQVLKPKSESSSRLQLQLRWWRSDHHFLKLLFKHQHSVFPTLGYFCSENCYLCGRCINASGAAPCVVFVSVQTFWTVQCLEVWNKISRQGLPRVWR